jgi:hypothetical protein
MPLNFIVLLIIYQEVLSNHLKVRIEILRVVLLLAIQNFKLNALCHLIYLPSA